MPARWHADVSLSAHQNLEGESEDYFECITGRWALPPFAADLIIQTISCTTAKTINTVLYLHCCIHRWICALCGTRYAACMH